jgi:rod shape-determining protein MreC
MESFFSRYRNLIVLLAVVVLQVIGLAVQVHKPVPASGLPGNLSGGGDTRDGKGVLLIRLWAAQMVTPFERGIHGGGEGISGWWSNYVDLRKTREQNKQLQATIDRLRLEQAMLREDALQGQRLQALLKFQENYIYKTTAAQVIGTSGSNQSHLVYLDKGSSDGLAMDMAVITGDGIVGKIRDVFPHTAQVLLINDQTSGAGVVLETTRIRGILRGNAGGQPQVVNILADSRIQPGEHVLTAGGDQIFPRGLPVGQVQQVVRDQERGSFINVIVKPAADLQHLDEVLVVISLEAHLSEQQMADLKTSEELKGAEVAAEAARKKAAAEMAERLPGLKDPSDPKAIVGPDGKLVDPKPGEAPAEGGPSLPPITPRPIQAKHPDRFSPGGAPDTTDPKAKAQPDSPDAPVDETDDSSATKPKTPAKPQSQTGTKPATKTPQAKPKTPQFGRDR